MIIEALTALSGGKIVLETFEILHFVHVGHASYKGGSSITRAIQQRLKKWQDPNNIAQQLEEEGKTLYDFKAIDDATHQDSKNKAKTYLTQLDKSVCSLNSAKDSFLKLDEHLTKLVHALKTKDENQFSSHLLRFESDFKSFKAQFKEFLSIERPPRQQLYIADLYRKGGTDETGVIEQYNDRLNTIEDYLNLLKDTKQAILKTIEDYIESLKDTKQDIADPQYDQYFDAIHTMLPATSSSSTHSFEQLQQDIKQDMYGPKQLSETMQAILPNNKEFAELCTYINQILTGFKQNNKTEQPDPFQDNPNWSPLLTEAKQIEVGQRIFLHAMEEPNHCEEEKLLLAQIFLRQQVETHVVNQFKIDLSSHELASILRTWQIKKCAQLIQFLSTLTQGAMLPEHDHDGLLEWLKTTRTTQSPVELFIKVLVSPCCFSQCSIESALLKLKDLSPYANSDAMIKKCRDSHWGAIREKNDILIRLPKSSSKILLRHCLEQDDQSQNSNVVSSVMDKLAKLLIADLKKLKAELDNNKHSYLKKKIKSFSLLKNAASKAKKNQEHVKGVERIREVLASIEITSPSSSLFPYLYNGETISEVEEEQQVATKDDLLYVIYRGVDPNGVCHWKSSSSQPYSESNQLLYYFLRDKKDDSQTKARIYALHDCQANAAPLYSHLFSRRDQLLALRGPQEETLGGSQEEILESQEEDGPLLHVILKDPKKISFNLTSSKALNGVSQKTMQETETVVEQLQNYHVLAFTRVNPEYRKKLPFMQQVECLFKNFFKSTQEIAEERLLSVRIIIGDFSAVVSAKNVDAINRALDGLNRNYESMSQDAKKIHKSTFYTILKKAFDGPFSNIRKQFNIVEQKQFELQEENSQFKEKVETLEETVEVIKQGKLEAEAKHEQEIKDLKTQYEDQQKKDKEAMEDQRKKDKEAMEAQRKKDKADSDAKQKESEAKLAQYETKQKESEAKLAQYETKQKESDEKIKELTEFMDFIKSQQRVSTSSASDVNMPESSNYARLFKH